ncbi:MAG TPA: metal-dependent phosphohydrolase [Planctomycetaceae bacterium]|nr:metal-dependent phosphohydrolase [Planctomycetaceae bacterium]
MQHPYGDIPELTNLEIGRGIVRIPVEQDVPFTPRVRALVDTPEFQRLRHITQLGLVSRVYPGATHTRFEHALGVFHNALRYVWQLGRDDRFCEIVDRHTAEVLLASALLHDLGHWPYCHPIEDMKLPGLPPHETFAAEFLGPDSPLAVVLQRDWNIQPHEILDVLVARTDTPAMRLVRSILSGPIDIDKMDYLGRDSLHCGVPYGRHFDRNRLMTSLVTNAAGDGLAISTKGRTAAELMVFARYVMFSEVYWHHAVRSATSMFARAFFHLHGKLDLEAFFRKSETETIDELRLQVGDGPCRGLLEGVFGTQRELYKRVAEFSFYEAPDLFQRLARKPYGWLVQLSEVLAEEVSGMVGTPVLPTQLLVDAPPPHREVEFDVEIYSPKTDSYRLLRDASPVIDALARTQFDDYVKRVRLFAHPDLARSLAGNEGFTECLERALDRVDSTNSGDGV